jgi:DNA polymerase III gamma/tau subunit
VDLHTEYRPQKLGQIVGNVLATQMMADELEDLDKTAHAWMFHGPSGCGKTTLARILAKELKADLIEVDAASNSGVKDMRSIVDGLLYSSISGARRLLLIDECHRLSAAAWDVLLKPMEEPPKHLYVALCTTEPAKLPKTIKTRPRSVKVELLSTKELDQLAFDICDRHDEKAPHGEVVDAAIEASNGSPRQMLVNLAACWQCEDYREASEVLSVAASEVEVIELCRALADNRTNAADALAMVRLLPDNAKPEACRIQIVRYFTAIALNPKSKMPLEKVADALSCFDGEYLDQEGKAPLLRSIFHFYL